MSATSRTNVRDCPNCGTRIVTEFEPAPVNVQTDGQVACKCGWHTEPGRGLAGRVVNTWVEGKVVAAGKIAAQS